MARFGFDFDADQVEISQPDFTLIPRGTKCWFELIEADIAATKSGSQLTYTAEIKGPEYVGRKIWGRITLECSTSAEAEKIGMGQLAALCKAIGIPRPSDTNELLGQPCEGTIGIKPGKGVDKDGNPYADQNIISYFKPIDAAPSTQPARQAAPAPKPAAPAAARKPWERAA